MRPTKPMHDEAPEWKSTVGCILALTLAMSCHAARPDESNSSTLGRQERAVSMSTIEQYWRAASRRDSTAMRALATSEQPVTYARPFWTPGGVFDIDPSALRVIDAYRVDGIRDTVFMLIEVPRVACPAESGDRRQLRFLFRMLPTTGWRIASMGSDPC